MKYLSPILSGLLLLAAANAANAQQQPAIKPLNNAPSNVEVVDGKRFFSLQKVRRYNSGSNTPRALSVMHHPHTESLVAHHITPLPNGTIKPTSDNNTPGPKAPPNQVLSIFAPEDKGTPPIVPIK
jgi:hypothetical protein